MGEPEMAEDVSKIKYEVETVEEEKSISVTLRRCTHLDSRGKERVGMRASHYVCFGLPVGIMKNNKTGESTLKLQHGPFRMLVSRETARAYLAKFENVEDVRKQLGMPHEVFAQPKIGRNASTTAPKRPPVFSPEDIKMLGEVIAAGVVAGLTAAKTGPVPVAPPGPHPTGPGVPKRV